MKTLSTTLLAAQKSASARPYVKAILRDYYGEGFRARFRRWYTGSETPGPVACVAAADGALIRARNDAGTLYVSRVAAPVAGSAYSAWSNLTGMSASSGVALVRVPGALWLLYVDSDDTTVLLRTSMDNGASWSGATTVTAAGGAKQHLAAVASPAGDVVVFWSEGAGVYSARWNVSTWGSRTAWSHTVDSVTGIAARHNGDFQVVIAGTEATTGHPKVWSNRFGDGFAAAPGAWSALRTVTEASAGAGVSFSNPALELFAGLWRLFYVETFSGDAGYVRVQYATRPSLFDFNTDQWCDAVAFDYDGNPYGVAACALTGNRMMLVAADGVWDATLLPSLDVSADVIEAAVDCDTSGSRVRVKLDNASGQFSGYGTGDLAVLQRGARLELTPGYITSSGNETNTTREYAYWVESIELVSDARPRLVLHCRGAEWLLQGWRARRQFVYAGGTVPIFGLLFVIAARAGLLYSATGNTSAAYADQRPAFTVHPGESGLTAMRRLIEKVSDVLFYDAGIVFATEPRATDAPQYAFGPGEHPVLKARYRDTGPAVNRARVAGSGVYGEAFDFDGIEAMGERFALVADANLNDAGDAEDRSESFLRDAAIDARNDVIEVFGVHCGVQLYDVVEVTDDAAGLASAPRRVLGYAWRYSTGARPRYDMSLTLGGV